MQNEKIECLVCNNRTLEERGSFEICPICFWEDEGEIGDPTKPTFGPNGSLSLEQARRNFKEFGAVSRQFIDKVRPAKHEEK